MQSLRERESAASPQTMRNAQEPERSLTEGLPDLWSRDGRAQTAGIPSRLLPLASPAPARAVARRADAGPQLRLAGAGRARVYEPHQRPVRMGGHGDLAGLYRRFRAAPVPGPRQAAVSGAQLA